MNKYIYVINGSAGAGKDTFVELVTIELNDIKRRFHTVTNISSVDKIKEIAKEIGWNGQKTEKDRKFLSDLKKLASDYCDMPFKYMSNQVKKFEKDSTSQILFLHIREPDEINRAVNAFHAKSILIIRDSVKQIISNNSDKNVLNYNYDIVIENNRTIDDLHQKAKRLVSGLAL